jgi:ribosomal protein S18 acetylase RimI-like enzyme
MDVIYKTLSSMPIRRVNHSEKADVLGRLSAAFESDPAARALYPLTTGYHRYFPSFIETFAGVAFTDGIVESTADGMGIALWLPPGVEPDPTPLITHLRSTIEGPRVDAILAGINVQARLHPHEPHWYLPFIGVHPEAQGQGLGGYLLQHGLDRADAEGLPAYLEATSARSARLYRRFGFEITGVVNAPKYPKILAMWRHPPNPTGSRMNWLPQFNDGR